jgi:hypothetical protein
VISLAILKHELQLDANPVSDLSKRNINNNNNNNNQARIKKYMRFMGDGFPDWARPTNPSNLKDRKWQMS